MTISYYQASENQNDGKVADVVNLQRVNNIEILVSNINGNCNSKQEIKNIFSSQNLNPSLQNGALLYLFMINVLHGVMDSDWCYVEITVYRWLVKIRWVDRVTYSEIVININQDFEVIKKIKQRKFAYFIHIIRYPEKYELLHFIIQGRIIGKSGTRIKKS